MDERRDRMDEPSDEEIADRLSASLFGSEADMAPDPAPAEDAPWDALDGAAPGFDASPWAEDADFDGWEAPSERDPLDLDPVPGAETLRQNEPVLRAGPEAHAHPGPDFISPPEQDPFDDGRYDQALPPEPVQPRVEPFVPTEIYREQPPRTRKKRRHRTKRNYAWAIFLSLGIALLIAGVIYLYNVRYNPSSFFDGASLNAATPTPGQMVSEQTQIDAAPTPTPAPTPTLDPYGALIAQADTSMMQNIVNILIIGVDYAEERETWSGKKEWHSDVMMVLAVNFDEKRADLISLPRDTYANIPGVKGIYKLNAAINCGGGMDAPGGAGFLKVCEAASWMLGGIPVNYYYAVTMPAVKGLVDAVGGVDYDLEMSYTMMGRRYYKGQQHMDGQAVLDYLRVRKNVSKAGDVHRVNRQKQMMVALFESMQQQNLILKIPDIISSFTGQLYTNCTLSQTAALASFAYELDKENIGMYSMGSKGGGNTNIFNWNFCLTDQANRVEIIKQVYGLDVPEEREYTPAYAKYRWAEMRADKYLSNCSKLLDQVADYIASGTMYIDPVTPLDPNAGAVTDPNTGVVTDPGLGVDPVMPEDPFSGVPDGGAVLGVNGFTPASYGLRPASPVLSLEYTQQGLDLYNSLRHQVNDFEDLRARASREAEKYRNGESNSFSSASSAFISALDSLQNTATELANNFGYGGMSWTVRYEKDTGFNEVTVDFN